MEVLRSAGHDFVIVQVHSADEQRPSAFGELMLEEAETGIRRTIECSREKAALYEKAFLEFSSQLQRVAVRNGGRYARAMTNIPYQEFVLQSLRSGTGAGMSWLALSPLQVLGCMAGGGRAGVVALPAPKADAKAGFHTSLLGRSAAQRLSATPMAARALGVSGADIVSSFHHSCAGEPSLGHGNGEPPRGAGARRIDLVASAAEWGISLDRPHAAGSQSVAERASRERSGSAAARGKRRGADSAFFQRSCGTAASDCAIAAVKQRRRCSARTSKLAGRRWLVRGEGFWFTSGLGWWISSRRRRSSSSAENWHRPMAAGTIRNFSFAWWGRTKRLRIAESRGWRCSGTPPNPNVGTCSPNLRTTATRKPMWS